LGGIFVSYRRSDSQGEAGRLFDDLVQRFGERMVFMDVAAIEAGRDFRKAIEEGVVQCGVLLVLMGPEWLHAKDEAGVRRLDDPSDFVRIETASALKRDIPVIPVLVHGAQMPRAEQLPDELKELAYRNCVELTHARWRSDINLLIEALRRVVGDASPTTETNQGKVPAPNQKNETKSSSHLQEVNSSRIDPAAVERVIRELALRIGPIAGVVVKRAALQCSSVEDLYRKVAEELDSAEEREKFLRQGALPPTPQPELPQASTPATKLPAKVGVSPPSDGDNAARGRAAATPSSRSKYFLLIGAGSVLLILCIALSLYLRSSRGSGSAESTRPAHGKLPETPSTGTTAERGETSSGHRAGGGALPVQRVPITEEVAHDLLIKTVVPAYPPLARQARVQGEVVLDADISKDGIVEELHTVKGHPMLIPAALDAAKQWRYKPYVLNGAPVAVSTQIIVKFTLK
jgi:TonB family protein